MFPSFVLIKLLTGSQDLPAKFARFHSRFVDGLNMIFKSLAREIFKLTVLVCALKTQAIMLGTDMLLELISLFKSHCANLANELVLCWQELFVLDMHGHMRFDGGMMVKTL